MLLLLPAGGAGFGIGKLASSTSRNLLAAGNKVHGLPVPVENSDCEADCANNVMPMLT